MAYLRIWLIWYVASVGAVLTALLLVRLLGW